MNDKDKENPMTKTDCTIRINIDGDPEEALKRFRELEKQKRFRFYFGNGRM